MAQWIDRSGDEVVGTVGFLIESTDSNHGTATRWHLAEEPGRTNQSREEKLGTIDEGEWLGSTNNVSRHAHGLARVCRISASGERMLVAPVVGRARDLALCERGYPDLAEHNYTDELAAEADLREVRLREPVTVGGWYETTDGRWAEVVWGPIGRAHGPRVVRVEARRVDQPNDQHE